jgi:hypothetical protein
MIVAAWLSALKTLGTKLDDVGVLARLMQRFDEFAHGWAGFG